ncbi:MAG: outer membrane beta-barrel protein [Gammaproteobacteria bacterium]|nr:outer membrane beta-barrel protein [Gammaproteobacteria bacterium]NIR97555.1 outer membrane beta-barrel protein [Gammaproteobacteria bacterium]NIT63193.1 outer membrane beta-barrel protein [Gammaproteobacteria bacterium]NIV20141.1 outer membrane beta-barrel protein [Gammaproteobacteria bacterium]NIX10477.1 outer membrane beta-barrel protein [Gammaproteobacteria bacterium]
MPKQLRFCLAAAVLAGSAAPTSNAALAAQAGDWLIRVGATHVSPDTDSDETPNVPAGSVDVDSDTSLGFTVGYMLTDHWGLELLGALPFEHDIQGAGSLSGVGTVGTTKHLPPVLSVQYHFQPSAKVRPYAGVGLNYTSFFDVEAKGVLDGQSLDLEDSWGLAAQVGADFDLSGRWFGNADLRYIDINTEASNPTTGTFDVEIDPWVFSLGIGTTF